MEDIANEKAKTEDILTEINTIKKCVSNLTNSVQSEKLESFVNIMNQNVTKLQDETEAFYNEKYKANNE